MENAARCSARTTAISHFENRPYYRDTLIFFPVSTPNFVENPPREQKHLPNRGATRNSCRKIAPILCQSLAR